MDPNWRGQTPTAPEGPLPNITAFPSNPNRPPPHYTTTASQPYPLQEVPHHRISSRHRHTPSPMEQDQASSGLQGFQAIGLGQGQGFQGQGHHAIGQGAGGVVGHGVMGEPRQGQPVMEMSRLQQDLPGDDVLADCPASDLVDSQDLNVVSTSSSSGAAAGTAEMAANNPNNNANVVNVNPVNVVVMSPRHVPCLPVTQFPPPPQPQPSVTFAPMSMPPPPSQLPGSQFVGQEPVMLVTPGVGPGVNTGVINTPHIFYAGVGGSGGAQQFLPPPVQQPGCGLGQMTAGFLPQASSVVMVDPQGVVVRGGMSSMIPVAPSPNPNVVYRPPLHPTPQHPLYPTSGQPGFPTVLHQGSGRQPLQGGGGDAAMMMGVGEGWKRGVGGYPHPQQPQPQPPPAPTMAPNMMMMPPPRMGQEGMVGGQDGGLGGEQYQYGIVSANAVTPGGQNPSSGTVAMPMQQGTHVSYQPGWIKEQLSHTGQAPPTTFAFPTYPHLHSTAPRPSGHQSPMSRHRAKPVDARMKTLYPHGYPSSIPRDTAPSSTVRSGGPVRFSPVVPGSMVQVHTGQYGCRSVRLSDSPSGVVSPLREDLSSMRLSQETDKGDPSPMETETASVADDEKVKVGSRSSPHTQEEDSSSSLSLLLNVLLTTRDEGTARVSVREVVRGFMRETYPELWRSTYCVPHKPLVSHNHPDKALVRSREGEFRVSFALEQLSVLCEDHIFLLSDYQYESFLHYLPSSKVQASDQPLVKEAVTQVRKEQPFGDFDLLLFHPKHGVMVLGLCSVNSNSDVQYILKRVQKTRSQLEKSVAVVERYVSTLNLKCPVIQVFCMPNLKRSFLSKVTSRDKHTERALMANPVLCSDLLPAQFRFQWLSAQAFEGLKEWWGQVKDKQVKVTAAQGQLRRDDLALLLGCFLCPRLSKVTFDQTPPYPPSESEPLIQEEDVDQTVSEHTTHKTDSSPLPSGEVNVSSLCLSIGGVTKTFSEFMDDYVNLYYPDFQIRSYRVPPIHFNIQKITREEGGEHSVLENPMSKDSRGDEGENRVVSAVEILGLKYAAVKPVFIICDFQYNNYLNKLKETMFVKGEDRRPRRAYGQSLRAQHDCLLIHRRYGVAIISVKAVGDNFQEWAISGSDTWTAVKRTLGKVLKQLPREEAMVKMVLGDLTSDLPCTKIVALPNLQRKDVDTAVSDDEELKQEIQAMFPTHGTRAFLCKDELCDPQHSVWDTYEQKADFYPNLCRWWDRAMGKGGNNVLSKQLYRQIIGRFCGLLSTVEVWSMQTPRVEVRNMEEAVEEMAERYSRILLTRDQLEILHLPDPFVFLSGPPGTGKTMLLVLRARQWLERRGEEEGQGERQVVIINLRHGSLGLPLGHLLYKQVTQIPQADPLPHPHHPHHPQQPQPQQQHNAPAAHAPHDKDRGNVGKGHTAKHHHSSPIPSPSSSSSTASSLQAPSSSSSSSPSSPSSSSSSHPTAAFVKRIDVDSRKFQPDQPGKLAEIKEGAYIIVDEIMRTEHSVIRWVRETLKPRAMWCAGQFIDCCPPGFLSKRMDYILRCPPMVQRVLFETSSNLGSVGKEMFGEDGVPNYVFTSTPYGLATDGFRPRFIFHAAHNSPSPYPLACGECGNELADILLKELRLQASTLDQVKKRKLGPLPAATTSSLSSKDIVVVCRQVQACPLITALKKRGLTVSVVTDTANPLVALPLHDTIVFTSPFAMTGLERKVMVYVPFETLDPLEEKRKKGGGDGRGGGGGGGELGRGKQEEGEGGQGDGEEETTRDDLRVRQALRRLTSEDRVSLWYTASRCTSQLIVVVP